MSRRSVLEEEPLEVLVEVKAGRLALPPGWVDEPLLPEPVRLRAGRRRARVRVEVTFGRRGRRTLAPPVLVLRDPFGLAERVVPGGEVHEVLVLPRIEAVRRAVGRRRGRRSATRAPRSSPPRRRRSTACASTSRGRPRPASTGRAWRAAPG